MSAADVVSLRMAALQRPPEPGETAGAAQLYAVLDGARDPRIHRGISETGLRHACLFSGTLHPRLARAAPYLVELREDASLARQLLSEGWGSAWGIFALSRADIPELRRHFRRLLQVRDESGRRLFFRYYDPRVLRAYLPTCTAQELQTVFGPVTRFVAEGRERAEVVEYSVRRGELRVRVSPDPGGM